MPFLQAQLGEIVTAMTARRMFGHQLASRFASGAASEIDTPSTSATALMRPVLSILQRTAQIRADYRITVLALSVPPRSLILHPHRFTLRARHLARRLDADRAGHSDHRLKVMLHIPGQPRAFFCVARRVGGALHLDGHGVERALTGQHDLVVRGETGESYQHGLDL